MPHSWTVIFNIVKMSILSKLIDGQTEIQMSIVASYLYVCVCQYVLP